jgi:L-2-aminoadipate reductase
MPLNPNGKIDKPALPFPDTVQAASFEPRRTNGRTADPTEESIRLIWSNILPNPPAPIPLDESFFDLGGHSILATRLIFELRKTFVVEAPLGLVFERPTVSGLAGAVDSLRNADLGFDYKEKTSSTQEMVNGHSSARKSVVEYGQDYETLMKELKSEYTPLSSDFGDRPLTIFLTGATGFLGAFVLRDLLTRKDRVSKVYCLVRASDATSALGRIRQGASDRGVWDEGWIKESRLEVLCGDLDQKSFGLEDNAWNRVASEADVVLHNGAFVSSLVLVVYVN